MSTKRYLRFANENITMQVHPLLKAYIDAILFRKTVHKREEERLVVAEGKVEKARSALRKWRGLE